VNVLTSFLRSSLLALSVMDLRDGVPSSPNFAEYVALVGLDEAEKTMVDGCEIQLKSPKEAYYAISLVCSAALGLPMARGIFERLRDHLHHNPFLAAINVSTAVTMLSALSGIQAIELQEAVSKVALSKLDEKKGTKS